MMVNEVNSHEVFGPAECSQADMCDPCRISSSNTSNYSDDSFEAIANNGFSSDDSQNKDASPFSPINTSSSSVTSVEFSPVQPPKQAFASTEPFVSKFSAQSDFLDFIDPAPARPPQYGDMPPGGCPRFPIFDEDYGNESLPSYSPAAYKVGVCSRKQEWLSPYEVSPTRSWKNVIIELNSTQLNVYSIPSQLDSTLMNIRINEHNQNRPTGPLLDTRLNSVVTTELDMEVRRVCDKLKLFDLATPMNIDQSELDVPLRSNFSSTSAHKVLKVCKQKKLLRSYSLQYAKIGLANDYTKKPNVLRLRLENEQFLLCFASTKEMIEWNLAFSIGKDVSLDLTEREIPKYRTVPRRRSTYLSRNTPFFNDVVTRRMRSRSEPLVESSSSTSLRGKFSKLKTKIATPTARSGSKAIKPVHETNEFRKPPSIVSMGAPQSFDCHRHRSSSTVNSATFCISSDDEFVSEELEAPHVRNTEEDLEDYLQNISDIRGSDEDDEFENDFDEFLSSRFNEEPSSQRDGGDEKWEPSVKFESRRRYLRNCVKCIRPLGFDDNWINKSLVKPTTMTPLTTVYVRNQYQMRDSSYSSLSDLCEDSAASTGPLNIRRKSGGNDPLYNLPDTSLARIPHHNLKEYSVGPHALIPKVL